MKALYDRIAGPPVRHAGNLVKRQQIDFAAQAAQEMHEPLRIFQGIVEITQQDIFKGNALPSGDGKGAARL